jgi:hypothetical protein
MGLREDLSAGANGVRWQTPHAFEWLQNDRRVAVARDAERQITWLVRASRFRLDVDPANDALLRADLEEDARHLFEIAHAQRGAQMPPRTADPTWSPIIEHERGALGLRVVRRITYQPGNETIAGHLSIPVIGGYVEIAAIARASMTGMREAILVDRAMAASDELPRLKQSEIDDPKHDSTFADHPLSLVRAALRWLEAQGVTVLAPAPAASEQAVVVNAARCVVRPPPRYLLLAPDVLPMSPTLASFTRITFADAEPRLLDVWRLPQTITARDPGAALVALARENADGWRREGATDVLANVSLATREPRIEAVSFIRFKVNGAPKTNASRWRVDPDGTVFRVGVSVEPHVPDASAREQADVVMASLRRLDDAS